MNTADAVQVTRDAIKGQLVSAAAAIDAKIKKAATGGEFNVRCNEVVSGMGRGAIKLLVKDYEDKGFKVSNDQAGFWIDWEPE